MYYIILYYIILYYIILYTGAAHARGCRGWVGGDIRDFKDMVFTFLRISLRFFEEFMAQEDVYLFFFELGPLNSIF